MTGGGALPREEVVEEITLGPNSRPQAQFLASRAQIVIGGGAAGGGKTYAAFLDYLPYAQGDTTGPDYRAPVPGFTGIFFRRLSPELTNEGGPWDSSFEVFRHFPDAEPIHGELEWRWPTFNGLRCTLRMTHLQHAWTVRNWDGAQVPWIYFDQLEHFEGSQFWYMLSRNRSATGIVGQMRAGCNPDPDSFVADLIGWWIDQEEKLDNGDPNPRYGFPIRERGGVVRYFFRQGDDIHWGSTRDELLRYLPTKLPPGITPRHLIKSMTFVPFKVDDNIDLMRRDPHYYGNLLALGYVERMRKLSGNWKVRPEAGKVFPKDRLKLIPTRPIKLRAIVRYWDKAASEKKGSDWSVGTLMGLYDDSFAPVVLNVVRGQWATSERERMIAQTAALDGKGVPIVIEQEPGSGGLDSAFMTITQTVPGYNVTPDRPGVDLEIRSRPFANQWQVGNVAAVIDHEWTQAWINEHHNYDGKPSTATRKDDQVASSAGAYNWLMKHREETFDPSAWATVRG